MHRHASLSATQTYIDRLKADILWVTQKDKKKALNIYKNLIKKNISNSTYRELFIKINALKDENIENLILNYLIKRKALGSYIYHFDKIKLDSKSFSIVNYLYARYYFNKKNYKESIFYLNRIDNNLPNIFNIEILKIKIISNFFLKKHSLSQKYSKDLHDISETYGLKEFSKNWIKINKYFSNKKAIDL